MKFSLIYVYFFFSEGNNHQTLGSILEGIYLNDVALEPDHRAKLQIVEEFLDEFKNFCLNNCPVFNRLFQYVYYTGSYFENLRVCKATEFDINIVLSLSSLGLKYEVSLNFQILSQENIRFGFSIN